MHINDIDLYYESTGEGEPLLLIHGLGSSTRNWELQVKHFSERYRVITYDLRGHGRSSKPPGPYFMQSFANDTTGLLNRLGIQVAHVVGVSMGGMIAFELAVRYPDLLKSLVIANSYPEMRVETAREHLEKWQRLLILELLGVRALGKVLSRRLFARPEQLALRRTFVERWAQNDKRAYKACLRAILGWDVEARLGEIRCPVLVVASDRDYWPLEGKQAYTAKMPAARLVVIGDARHAVCVEKPEEFNRVLEEFLSAQ
jgi:pimeloyl-ACP methyl ester carboxylesterase